MSRTDLPAYLETSVSYGNAMPCKWLKMQRFQLTAVHSIMRGQHKHWDVKLFLEQSSKSSLSMAFAAIHIESVLFI